ncbi:MAG: DNA replication and repair protein RecF, partial [Cellvibrionales bacterium]|nr:DNA replication and repair protein RecF [Cellvibrionales bacterium]
MRIQRLLIENVRNLTDVSIEDFAQVNLFKGLNASGKTAFLEALSLLSVGRSFRTRNVSQVITHKQDHLSVYADCQMDNMESNQIGILRSRSGQYRIRFNGETVKSLATLSYSLPSLLFAHASLQLLEEPASSRLKFLDWGVFHVEHSFLSLWQTHNKHLEYRNQLLKSRKPSNEFSDINQKLCHTDCEIERLRYKYLSEVIALFKQLSASCNFTLGNALDFYYKDGFNQGKYEIGTSVMQLENNDVIAQFASAFERESKRGYSLYHAGKSDIEIHYQSLGLAKHILSKGEMKTVCFFLKMAQAIYLDKTVGIKPILLIDDLGAELDSNYFEVLINLLFEYEFQCFITMTDNLDIARLSEKNGNIKMFHV